MNKPTTSIFHKLLHTEKWHMLIIILLSILLYANTLQNGFALDDKVVFTENQFVQKGFEGIPDIYRFDSFRGYFTSENTNELVTGGRYRPFSLMIFASIQELFGQNAFVAHLVNILLFCITCLMLYYLLKKIIALKFPEQAAPISFLSTLLFVTHPIHTEVVANIKGLDEILALLFSLLAGWFLYSYVVHKKIILAVCVILFFTMAVFSKESALIFVVVFPISYYLFVKQTFKANWLSVATFVIPAIFYIVQRSSILGKSSFIENSTDFLNNNFLIMRGDRLVEMNLPERLGIIFYSLFKYIQLLFFPYPLTHDYSPKVITSQHLFSVLPFLGLLIYITLIGLALWHVKRNTLISFGIILFCIALLPVSNLFFPIGTAMAERFVYISSIGFCLVIATLLNALNTKNANLFFGISGIVILLFSAQTIFRNTAWKDDLTLFNRDYKTSSKSVKLNSALGLNRLEAYRASADKENNMHLLDQGIFHLQKSVEIFPGYYQCLFLLGNAQYLKKDYQGAIHSYEKYIDKNPSDGSILKNYQKALRESGRDLVHNQKKNEEAKKELLKSLKLAPNDAQTLELLGIAEAELGYLDNSISYLKQAIDVEPTSATAWANLYISYSRKGDKYSAQHAVTKAMELDKDVVKKLMTVKVK